MKINASVIIVNYNNAIFLNKSINSILSQSVKSLEIIVVDDMSSDNSMDVLKKYKGKIISLKNSNKTKHGSYNQMNSFYKGYLKSKGEYIFFLDSDDFFKVSKVKIITEIFEKNENIDLIFDLPIYKYKKKNIKKKFNQKKFLISNWPRFSPQSCMSMRRKFAKEIFQKIKIKKFESIWFDFRVALYYFLKNKNIFVINKYLTYYRQLDNSASKKYKLFSKHWWYRRNQAHDFVSVFSRKLKISNRLTIDKIITKLICLFIND